ncbi:MAG: cytochrome C oxidase subunit IV family protein [Candidatus Riflebacteria bacterium]|nr:cytochrome C oxidase subunit IV family protein [Candidatus Riflebacteria bacterium]
MSEISGKKTLKVSPTLFPFSVGIWLLLLALTGLTLLNSLFNLGRLNIWIALTISTSKASLVALFFMNLKDEPPLIKYVFLLSLLLLGIFIGFTFFDVWFR